MIRILPGDCRETLRELDADSVHCCVTSPPYWGLRAYIDDPREIGREKTPEQHLANIVDVFREVRRVLRDDGTLWLNYSDAYASENSTTKECLPLSASDAAWLAAFIDGEGSIQIRCNKRKGGDSYAADVSVGMSEPGMIDFAFAVTGLGSKTDYPNKKYTAGRVYYWCVAGQQAANLLRAIYPRLIVKRKQAALAVMLANDMIRKNHSKKNPITSETLEYRDSLRRAVSDLNQKREITIAIDEPETPLVGYKPKDLLSMPFRVVEALRHDGWYHRSTIIWSKKSPMPESVRGTRFERCRYGAGAVVVANFLKQARQNAGKTQKEVAALFPSSTGGVTGCVWNWENGANVPTANQWAVLKEALQFDASMDEQITKWHGQEKTSAAQEMPDERVKPYGVNPDWLADWESCPGCSKCSANDGYVLRMNAGRPTTSMEYVFLLTKSPSYFYNMDGNRVAHAEPWRSTGKKESDGPKTKSNPDRNGQFFTKENREYNPAGRNLWTVWDDLKQSNYKGAHFATMPLDLALRCVKLGTSDYGCCPTCGAQWAPVVETDRQPTRAATNNKRSGVDAGNTDPERHETQTNITEWRATCQCEHNEGGRPVILDPFHGSGTSGEAARECGCDYIGCELNDDYVKLGNKRFEQETFL